MCRRQAAQGKLTANGRLSSPTTVGRERQGSAHRWPQLVVAPGPRVQGLWVQPFLQGLFLKQVVPGTVESNDMPCLPKGTCLDWEGGGGRGVGGFRDCQRSCRPPDNPLPMQRAAAGGRGCASVPACAPPAPPPAVPFKAPARPPPGPPARPHLFLGDAHDEGRREAVAARGVGDFDHDKVRAARALEGLLRPGGRARGGARWSSKLEGMLLPPVGDPRVVDSACAPFEGLLRAPANAAGMCCRAAGGRARAAKPSAAGRAGAGRSPRGVSRRRRR